jgi:hypothetical protein
MPIHAMLGLCDDAYEELGLLDDRATQPRMCLAGSGQARLVQVMLGDEEDIDRSDGASGAGCTLAKHGPFLALSNSMRLLSCRSTSPSYFFFFFFFFVVVFTVCFPQHSLSEF